MNKSKRETATQVSRVTIDAPIETVWQALIKEGEVLPFFFGSVLHTTTLAPGAPVRMRSPNGKYTAVVGDVLELNPPYKYSCTFKFTNYDDAVCKVTHDLKQVGNKTEYTLTSEHVPVGTKTEKNMKQGGEFIVNELKRHVETGRPSFMARFIMIMGKLFAFTNPKSTLSSNWPLDKRVQLPND